MRKFAFIFLSLFVGTVAYAIPYQLIRQRTLTTAQINALFQIAVDRGVWPGANTDIQEMCAHRMPSGGGHLRVTGSRSGTDTQMSSDRANTDDRIVVE